MIFRAVVRRAPAAPPRCILVRLPNWVGDLLMARPALHAIRARWPQARLVGMTRPAHRALAERCGVFDALLDAPSGTGLRRAWRVWHAVRAVRRCDADTAVVMAVSFESALTVRLAGVPHRIGHRTDRRAALFTTGVAVDADAHRADDYLGLARALDAGDAAPVPPLALTAADRAFATRLFAARGWRDDVRPVFVNPAAAKTARAWSSDRFRRLAERLAGPPDGRPVVVHARPPFPPMAPGWDLPSVALLREATLPELAALLERCALYVGNDSGPAHLAAAAGIPTVTIHGSSTPTRTGPRAAPGVAAVAVTAGFACSPCRERFFEECPSPPSADGRPPCLDAVDLEQVAGVVERLLGA